MKVEVDTNILYQALRSRTGASHAILQLVRTGELQLAISVPVFEEYKEVLLRPSVLRHCYENCLCGSISFRYLYLVAQRFKTFR